MISLVRGRRARGHAVPRHLEPRARRRRARPAVDGVRARLRHLRQVLRVLHRRGRRHPHRGVPALEQPGPGRPGHAPARARRSSTPRRTTTTAGSSSSGPTATCTRPPATAAAATTSTTTPRTWARCSASCCGSTRTWCPAAEPLPPDRDMTPPRAAHPVPARVSGCCASAARWPTAAPASACALSVGATLRIGKRSYRLRSARAAGRRRQARADEGGAHARARAARSGRRCGTAGIPVVRVGLRARDAAGNRVEARAPPRGGQALDAARRSRRSRNARSSGLAASASARR